MKYSIGDLLHDCLYVVLIALIGSVFLMSTAKPDVEENVLAVTASVDTLEVLESASVKEPVSVTVEEAVPTRFSNIEEFPHHVNLGMLDSLAPYPLLAYTTVIAESGWPTHKSNLAKKVNNNIGMMIPVSRFNACTIEDTAAIRNKLGLVFGKDYDYYRYKGVIVKNKRGEKMVAYNKTWAIFLTLEDCAKDLGEYQSRMITPKQASSPRKYLARLRQLNYFTDSDEAKGYTEYWMNIYEKLRKQHHTDSTTSSVRTGTANSL